MLQLVAACCGLLQPVAACCGLSHPGRDPVRSRRLPGPLAGHPAARQLPWPARPGSVTTVPASPAEEPCALGYTLTCGYTVAIVLFAVRLVKRWASGVSTPGSPAEEPRAAVVCSCAAVVCSCCFLQFSPTGFARLVAHRPRAVLEPCHCVKRMPASCGLLWIVAAVTLRQGCDPAN